MPVWKASREGIRERERERGEKKEGKERGGLREGGGHCVVWDRRGFVCWGWLHHPSVFLWIWSQQHILFCHYLRSWYSSTECCKLAPERRHIFSACLWQNNSWRIVWTGNSEIWAILFERHNSERFLLQCHTCRMFLKCVLSPISDKKMQNTTWSFRVDSIGWEWMED